jgi:hypothetical protein
MGEQLRQSVADVLTALLVSVASVLLPPTILLLLLKSFVPAIGTPLWQAWGRLVGWLVLAPIRVVRFLVREASGRRHR